MADTEDTTTTTVETVTPPAAPTTDAPADTDPIDELPQWARTKLTKANGEAANYRTRLREAEEKLLQAKTPDDMAAAIADFKTKNASLELELAQERIARTYKLPDDLAEELKKVKDPVAMEALAKTLQKHVASAGPESLSGGLDPSGDEEDFDPVKAARAARARRY